MQILTAPLGYARPMTDFHSILQRCCQDLRNLVQHKVAHGLLQRVNAVLQTKSEQPVSWHNPNGSLNLRRFIDIVNKLEDQTLKVVHAQKYCCNG